MAWGYRGAGSVLAFGGLALVLVLASVLLPGDRAGGDSPGGPEPAEDEIVARLETGGQAYPPALRAAMAAARAAPGDEALAQDAARALIAEGRALGDSRLVGAAVAVLRPFLAQASARTLYLAATARQYQHDFPGALALLDQALALAPSDVNARLSRATIRTVQGDYPAARADCAEIAARGRADVGFLCQATTHVLTREGPALAARITGILAQPGLLDPGLQPWARGLVAEIALHHGDLDAARLQLDQVLAEDPGALRERLLLADIALAQGRAAEAQALLAPAPSTDGVALRQALAARALGDTRLAARLTEDLARGFARNLDLGLTAHAREEAQFYLRLARDPVQALARARVNWDLQHEAEDAALLIAAAEAAGQPEATKDLRRWMDAQDVVPPFPLFQP